MPGEKRKVEKTDRIERINNRIDKLSTIKSGWLGRGDGKPTNEVCLENARNILTDLATHLNIANNPWIFPTPNGEIEAEWEIDKFLITADFKLSGGFEVAITNFENDHILTYSSPNLPLESQSQYLIDIFKNFLQKNR